MRSFFMRWFSRRYHFSHASCHFADLLGYISGMIDPTATKIHPATRMAHAPYPFITGKLMRPAPSAFSFSILA